MALRSNGAVGVGKTDLVIALVGDASARTAPKILTLGTTSTSGGRMSANTCSAGWMQKSRLDYQWADLLSHHRDTYLA